MRPGAGVWKSADSLQRDWSTFSRALHSVAVGAGTDVVPASNTPANWRLLFDMWRTGPLPRYREWACELAVAYGGRELLPILESLAEDADGHVRNRAGKAVRALNQRRLTSS